jgi:hypothetical protein
MTDLLRQRQQMGMTENNEHSFVKSSKTSDIEQYLWQKYIIESSELDQLITGTNSQPPANTAKNIANKIGQKKQNAGNIVAKGLGAFTNAIQTGAGQGNYSTAGNAAANAMAAMRGKDPSNGASNPGANRRVKVLSNDSIALIDPKTNRQVTLRRRGTDWFNTETGEKQDKTAAIFLNHQIDSAGV